MLPRDTKNRRESAAADTQSRLDPHLKEKLVKERVILYTDDLFQAVAIEWLVSTDQVSDSKDKLYTYDFDVAYPGVAAPCVSNYDPHCCLCNKWGQYSQWPSNSTSDYGCLQEAANSITDKANHMYYNLTRTNFAISLHVICSQMLHITLQGPGAGTCGTEYVD